MNEKMGWIPFHDAANSKPLFLTIYATVIVGIVFSSFYVFSAIYSNDSSTWFSSSSSSSFSSSSSASSLIRTFSLSTLVGNLNFEYVFFFREWDWGRVRLRLRFFRTGKRRNWFVEFGWERGGLCHSVDLLGVSHYPTVLPANEGWR